MKTRWLPAAQAIAFMTGLFGGWLGLAAKANLSLEGHGAFIDLGYFLAHAKDANRMAMIYWACVLLFMAGLIAAMLLEYWKRKAK
jgi:hypothetical protein